MFGFQKFDDHSTLVNKMGDTVGVDLVEELQRGTLSPSELRGAVLRCVGCRETGKCRQFLAEHAGETLDHTPSYCRNADTFEALKGE
ncbi:MAG: DUF6455 family protein [Rhodovulum sp.]|jgi:hypothetical protein|uniref:DUF6455 family protein n=1 Tax=Rhodovulum sp. FJ3 TaxID=3079053 RepID=UPI00293DDDC6|nr:DUF6455 family protein [Rhodovulum sp. FJ3]MCI5085949.1 DUF6455 family protein [Rhodovulum sp.]MDV4167039.1 DUF6455 family protein [Rhodovulum sp. FJ3]